MRYVAAYLLAVLGGNKNPSADNTKNILGSVSIDVDDDRLNIIMSELKGKNIEEVIAACNKKLASIPSNGAVAISAGAGVAGSGAAAEEKKEAKKEEFEKESDDDMGFGLFD